MAESFLTAAAVRKLHKLSSFQAFKLSSFQASWQLPEVLTETNYLKSQPLNCPHL
jgi:hypothetical protein